MSRGTSSITSGAPSDSSPPGACRIHTWRSGSPPCSRRCSASGVPLMRVHKVSGATGTGECRRSVASRSTTREVQIASTVITSSVGGAAKAATGMDAINAAIRQRTSMLWTSALGACGSRAHGKGARCTGKIEQPHVNLWRAGVVLDQTVTAIGSADKHRASAPHDDVVTCEREQYIGMISANSIRQIVVGDPWSTEATGDTGKCVGRGGHGLQLALRCRIGRRCGGYQKRENKTRHQWVTHRFLFHHNDKRPVTLSAPVSRFQSLNAVRWALPTMSLSNRSRARTSQSSCVFSKARSNIASKAIG